MPFLSPSQQYERTIVVWNSLPVDLRTPDISLYVLNVNSKRSYSRLSVDNALAALAKICVLKMSLLFIYLFISSHYLRAEYTSSVSQLRDVSAVPEDD